MDGPSTSPGFSLAPFQALRLADSHVGDPLAHRILSRPYRAVPGRIIEWRKRNRLALDTKPALYVHEYTSHGVTVRGVVGLLDLNGARQHVHPHEAVHIDQVEQLASRLDVMQINPAPILLMHRGPTEARALLDRVMATPPHLVYTDRADQLHRIWRIEEPSEQTAVAEALKSTHAVIADGHHRMAAATRLHERHPGTGWDSTLVMLVDQTDTPLQLSAIHRTIPRLDLTTVAQQSEAAGGLWTRHESSHQALAMLDHALVLHDGTSWATIEPHHPQDLLVRWLHEELLPRWQVTESQVTFHHSATEAIAHANIGISVLLPAPRFDQVEASARSGVLLPQKATSFQPKPHVGVLMRTLHVATDEPG